MNTQLEKRVVDAEIFLKCFNTQGNKRALDYYNQLDEVSQRYIRETKPYSLIFKSAGLQV